MYDKKNHLISRDVYIDEIMRVSSEKCIIRSATIELLDSCNYKCEHCYVKDSYKNIISKEKFFWLIDELKKEGCIWLTLTGGEILLHPNFMEMYIYAFKAGLNITLFTNGYAIDDNLINTFLEYMPENIEITLYGGTSTFYDKYVGVQGAFDKIRINIQKLHDARIPFSLKTILTTKIYSDYENIKSFANVYNENLRIDGHILPKLNNSDISDLRLAPEIVLMEEIKNSKRLLNAYRKKLEEYKMTDALYSCAAGRNSVFFDANMNMCLCLMARHIYCSVGPHTLSIKEAQNNILIEKENKECLCDEHKCYKCKLRILCRYCPGQFLLENNSEYKPITWYCNYTKTLYSILKGTNNNEDR